MESQTNSTNKNFATASLILGILALASFCTIIGPFLFGGLSIFICSTFSSKRQAAFGHVTWRYPDFCIRHCNRCYGDCYVHNDAAPDVIQ